MIAQLISGGQTGVDRAALDVALELGIQEPELARDLLSSPTTSKELIRGN